MSESRTNAEFYGVSAEFADPDALVAAADALRKQNFGRLDALSPLPIPGLAAALGMRGPSLGWISMLGVLIGGFGCFGMIVFATVASYPFNIGGRPLLSWPYYVVPSFAAAMLLGALFATVGMLFLNRLPRLTTRSSISTASNAPRRTAFSWWSRHGRTISMRGPWNLRWPDCRCSHAEFSGCRDEVALARLAGGAAGTGHLQVGRYVQSGKGRAVVVVLFPAAPHGHAASGSWDCRAQRPERACGPAGNDHGSDAAPGPTRYNIYCAPCHGRAGDGSGMIVHRGFPQPPSFFKHGLLNAKAQHFYNVITNGHGVMYSYADRVLPADRWAIIAYIRALQESQHAKVVSLPERDRKMLQEASR